MKIFILAGGFGTRLQSVVSDVPKPMAPIWDNPFLDYQIEYIRKFFPEKTIYLLTHYKSKIIEDYYKDDKSIEVIKESKPLGTGGSIKNAIKRLKLENNVPLLILNGDTYITPNLEQMTQNTREDIVILSSYQTDCSRYGTLNIDNYVITSFNEKIANSKNKYINAGCYYFNNLNFFDSIKKMVFSIESEFMSYLDNGNKIATYPYNGIFIDIGIPEDYNKMIKHVGNNE